MTILIKGFLCMSNLTLTLNILKSILFLHNWYGGPNTFNFMVNLFKSSLFNSTYISQLYQARFAEAPGLCNVILKETTVVDHSNCINIKLNYLQPTSL